MLNTDMQEILMSDYLRVPTLVLRMQQVLKNASLYGCLQFIWAKTGGWGKGKDTISYSQFKNDERYGTGLSEKTIQRSVEKLAELGVINMSPSFNRMYEYSINIEKIKSLTSDLSSKNKLKVRSICPDLANDSPVILSASPVILSASPVILSSKSGHFDLHTKPFTQDFYTKLITQDCDKFVSNEKIKPVTAKQKRALLVQSLFDKWLELSGQNITPSKTRLSHINARLDDGYSAEDIIFVMTFVATDSYRVENGWNKIELAIRSVDQYESMFIAATAAAKKLTNNPSVTSKPQDDYKPAFNGWNERNPDYQPPSQQDHQSANQDHQPDVYHPSQEEFKEPIAAAHASDNWHWKEPLPGMTIPQTEKHLKANKLAGESATKTYKRLLSDMQASSQTIASV